MPGSTPATSQLDWLSSTTAMIVLSWSKATRDLLKSFSWGITALRQLFASDDGAISSSPAPYHLSVPQKTSSVPGRLRFPFAADYFSLPGNQAEATSGVLRTLLVSRGTESSKPASSVLRLCWRRSFTHRDR